MAKPKAAEPKAPAAAVGKGKGQKRSRPHLAEQQPEQELARKQVPVAAWEEYASDEEEQALEEYRHLLARRRPRVTGNRDAPTPPSHRIRRASQKVRENEETEEWVRQQQQRRSGGAAALSPSALRAPRSGAEKGRKAWRRRGGGMGGMGGFGVRGSSRGGGPLHQPILLLPGEWQAPLHVERYFGEARQMLDNGRTGTLVDGVEAGPGAALPVEERYRAGVDEARRRLAERMKEQGRTVEEVESMLCLLRDFEAKCLAGEPATPQDCKQMCIDVERRLREVYGELVLGAHDLSARALLEQEGQEDVQLMRVMERRFIIWQPTDVPAAQGPGHATTVQQQEQQQSEQPQQQQQQEEGHGAVGGAWDRGLAGIWREFTHRLKDKKYGDITLSTADDIVSCALNDTEWRDGQLKRVGVKKTSVVLKQIEHSKAGKRSGRLYVTDGSMPDYEAQSYPHDVPGMPCGVDAAANAMLPHAVRSSRATNLFHNMKSESTGTKTFTLFGPAGGGTNLTAFHFETKRRRSFNLGTGDFIVQPLATMEAMRKVMRVHAAVAGRHTRHGQLLPLEVYLEEGIPLVLHVRDYPYATLCELCEQSLHAFVSFNTVACTQPALKVSCNDLDLVWELDSCYHLEKLATLYSDMRMLPEEALPPDGADSWVMSSYLLRRPHTLAKKRAGWEAPWLCEAKGGAAAAVDELEDDDMHWSMDLVGVRCAEKMLDVLAGKLAAVEAWAGEVPSDDVARQALRRARPVLQDMRRRAVSEAASPDGAAFQPRWPLECHFSAEYLGDLLGQVDAALSDSSSSPSGADAYGSQPAPAPDAAAPGGLHPALLTAEAHAAYAAAASQEERVQLAAQADHMLQAAASPAATMWAVPLLSEQPPAVLRSHWLLRMQLEWEAMSAEPFSLRSLRPWEERRVQRSHVEGLLDKACTTLAERHRQDWGVRT